jgi:hypothetical protein
MEALRSGRITGNPEVIAGSVSVLRPVQPLLALFPVIACLSIRDDFRVGSHGEEEQGRPCGQGEDACQLSRT